MARTSSAASARRAAAIHGPTPTFESAFGYLGSWQGAGDHASCWSFQVETLGTFTIALEWACADESAGNTYELRVGP
jgi:hypothetical protein